MKLPDEFLGYSATKQLMVAADLTLSGEIPADNIATLVEIVAMKETLFPWAFGEWEGRTVLASVDALGNLTTWATA